MAMNLKDFFDIDKVTFSIEDLEAPYEELRTENEKMGYSSISINEYEYTQNFTNTSTFDLNKNISNKSESTMVA